MSSGLDLLVVFGLEIWIETDGKEGGHVEGPPDALSITRAFSPRPLAGISAIFFTDTGALGKLYSEPLENIDGKQREDVRSLGANPGLVQRFGIVPQVLPVFVSQSLSLWESNTRSATIIGAAAAGGIGLKLWEAMHQCGSGKCRLYGAVDPVRGLCI